MKANICAYPPLFLYNCGMVCIDWKNFDLRQIALSGQCFRMDEVSPGKFLIIAGDKAVVAKQGSAERPAAGKMPESDATAGRTAAIRFHCTKREWETFWSHYFDTQTDYAAIINQINPRDKYLTKAAEAASGVRILNQDLWEMIFSFLISQQNNIPRIKKSIKAVSEKYGREIDLPKGLTNSELATLSGGAGSSDKLFAVPTPETLAHLKEDALMSEGLGYRSKYVVRTAREIAEGAFDLDALKELSYEEASKKLLTLYGIGKKVADCVCLFGLHHVEAFPIDTHVSQILAAHYKKGFPHKRYQGFAGILQQYMFYYDLNG